MFVSADKTNELKCPILCSAAALRLYLVNVHTDSDGVRQFEMRTHNLKPVSVCASRHVTCLTSDCAGKGTCEHIIAFLLNVLRLPRTHPLIQYESGTDSSSIPDIGAQFAVFESATPLAQELRSASPHGIQGRRITGHCEICRVELTKTKPLVICKNCGQTYHETCWAVYGTSRNNKEISCLACKEQWKERTDFKEEMVSTREMVPIYPNCNDARKRKRVTMSSCLPSVPALETNSVTRQKRSLPALESQSQIAKKRKLNHKAM